MPKLARKEQPFVQDTYIEPGQPGALERDERLLKEWIKAYHIEHRQVASQKEVLDEFMDELKADKRSTGAPLRLKLSTYIQLHKETLDRGLYHRAQNILDKLKSIEAQTNKTDPRRALEVRGMMAELQQEWMNVDPRFRDQSLEQFRLAEERAWMDAVCAHEDWSSHRGGETDHLFAKLANMIGVVRRADDPRLEAAAGGVTAKHLKSPTRQAI